MKAPYEIQGTSPSGKHIKDKLTSSYHNFFKIEKFNHWKISDDSNIDQYKAVTGICFMIGILTILGLYSNLL